MTDSTSSPRSSGRVFMEVGFEQTSLAEFGILNLQHPLVAHGPFVRFNDLTDLVSSSFRRRGIKWPDDWNLGVGCLLDLFGALEVDARGGPVLTWAATYGYAIEGEHPGRNPVIITDDLYVTRRFAHGVLNLVRRGIIRVSVEKLSDNSYAVFGYDVNGVKFSILKNQDSGYVAIAI